MYGRNGNWIDDDNNFKESRKYNDHNKDDCHHQRFMPQGIETMAEREVGNNIVNNRNVGIEMGDVAGEAGGMAVQSSNRQRREKERKRKYCARKSGPVDVSAKIASQQMKHAEYDCTYKAQEHVKESDAEKKRNTHHSTKTAQQAGPVEVSAKIASQ
jgi:hypothetical protein